MKSLKYSCCHCADWYYSRFYLNIMIYWRVWLNQYSTWGVLLKFKCEVRHATQFCLILLIIKWSFTERVTCKKKSQKVSQGSSALGSSYLCITLYHKLKPTVNTQWQDSDFSKRQRPFTLNLLLDWQYSECKTC